MPFRSYNRIPLHLISENSIQHVANEFTETEKNVTFPVLLIKLFTSLFLFNRGTVSTVYIYNEVNSPE